MVSKKRKTVQKKRAPTAEEFFRSKRIVEHKKVPVWVYLEKEMREKSEMGVKPYNDKVGVWLKYLRDLKYHYYSEENEILEQLEREAGPEWFFPMSNNQKRILKDMKTRIHQDMLRQKPLGTRISLRKLGINLQFTEGMLMRAMYTSEGDTGIFFWNLFKMYYEKPPNDRLSKYDINSRLMMSALVFIDYDECVQELHNLTTKPHPPTPIKKEHRTTYVQPNVRFGEYLSRTYVPPIVKKKLKEKKPLPFDYKIRLKSDESYTDLMKSTINTSIQKRKDRLAAQELKPRECKYRFWRAPERACDAKTRSYNAIINMWHKTAKPRYLKYKVPFENIQCQIGNVVYIAGAPRFLLQGYLTMPTEYIIHNGGCIGTGLLNITHILGAYKYPPAQLTTCLPMCQCLQLWGEQVMSVIEKEKCTCGHRYDFHLRTKEDKEKEERDKKLAKGRRFDKKHSKHSIDRGKFTKHSSSDKEKEKETVVKNTSIDTDKKPAQLDSKYEEKYFYPPKKHSPLYFDEAAIYKMDRMDKFIRDCVEEKLRSYTPTSTSIEPSISANTLPISELLKVMLGDLAETPLLLPHLPDAHLLINLQAWTRKRLRGDPDSAATTRYLLKSKRRQLQLDRMDWRTRAYRIPFTQEQLATLNFSNRQMLQELYTSLFNNFKHRAAQKHLQLSRLLWAPMKSDMYPSEGFVNAYFAYMPAREQDTYYLSPFNPNEKIMPKENTHCHLDNVPLD